MSLPQKKRIVENSVIFLTGADGGLGRALIAEFASRGAAKIYAAGINENGLGHIVETFPGLVFPVVVDVANWAAVEACAAKCVDTNVLVNNAGIERGTDFLSPGTAASSQLEMAVNYHGTLHTCTAFLPLLRAHAQAAILNILSLASVSLVPGIGTYCASKAAAHVLTLGVRRELVGTNVSVHGAYPGYLDTDMAEDVQGDKASPAYAACQICDQLEEGRDSIFPDPMSRNISASLNFEIPVIGA